MKTLRLPILLFTLLFIAATVQGQTKYEKYGISFTVPAGWKIADEAKGEGVFTFLCEKKGDDAPSVSFIYLDGPMNIDDMLQSTMVEFDNATMGQGQALHWETPVAGKIGAGSYVTKQVTFTADDGRDTETGIIYSFSLCGKTAIITFTDSDNGHEKNAAAFDAIKNSITCK